MTHITGLGFNHGLGEPLSRYGSAPFGVAGIQGALFVMRREVYDAIGGFDACGFLYHEDVNVSWLLRLAGYRLYCAPSSRIRHDYFLSMYAEKFHLLERNRVVMLLAACGSPHESFSCHSFC
jgi:GT2 family glycosyltransferase